MVPPRDRALGHPLHPARRLSVLLAFAIEELEAGAPPFVEQALRALVRRGVDTQPLFAARIIARGHPPTAAAVELHPDSGHDGAYLWHEGEPLPERPRMGWPRGFEPPTPRATVWCSAKLSYGHHAPAL